MPTLRLSISPSRVGCAGVILQGWELITRGWVPPQARAARAWPAALTLADRARAQKHDTDLSNRLADQASGLPGRGAVLTIAGLRNAGTLPGCRAPAREQVTGLAGAGDTGIGAVILIRDHASVCQDRGIVQASRAPGAG